jgi:hypothetical protein
MHSLLTREDIEYRLAQSGWKFIRKDDSGTSLYGHSECLGGELPVRWDTVRLDDLIDTLMGTGYLS